MSRVYLWKIEVIDGVAEIRNSTVSVERKDYCDSVGVRVQNSHAE